MNIQNHEPKATKHEMSEIQHTEHDKILNEIQNKMNTSLYQTV